MPAMLLTALARSQIAGTVDHDNIIVHVEDAGPGISPSVREQIFEPFFTTKSVGSGTGLGLSLVFSIVSKHGGRIRVDDDFKDGTRMIVSLPIVSADAIGSER